ncbi:transmembrane protein 59 [Pimephales promelas]|uniref:transmembrane protein 59 n=1 Tax=Pimephales promelas TaxID=90988 RepID=UPI0019557036|nr:transmembrane protein 59 [Pimephales promelas]KAG1969944.1 transmembrane protein [Pimephales promelas]
MSAIKSCGILISFCCIFTSSSASSEVFDGVLGNTASCHKTCQMTYSLHTYPREEALYACQRGCRLFSICQFVGDSRDLNETQSECESACREAYSQSDERYACNLGCQSQQPFAEQRMEQLLMMMPRIHLLYPLTLVRGFWEDMMSQAHSFITSSWTFYLQADDGKVVIFQSEPQIQFIPQFEFQTDETEESQSTFVDQGMKSPVYKDYPRSSIQERDRDMFIDGSNSDDDYKLFNCLSRNPWLPSWILTTTLVLSVFVLIWICCATVSTAVEQYVPAEKLSINGDMEYMKNPKLTPYLQSSLVIIRSPGVEQEEAGPLPSKVNLDQSNI